jgi:hypothetical protein
MRSDNVVRAASIASMMMSKAQRDRRRNPAGLCVGRSRKALTVSPVKERLDLHETTIDTKYPCPP